MFSRELERPETACLFVIRGETQCIAGHCSALVVHGEVHINNLAVDPARRGRSCGGF